VRERKSVVKYGDFSSLVQLGVGLHVGTIILQMYGELGMAPLGRVIARTRGLFLAPRNERPPQELEEELAGLESKFEIFKIQFFQEYRRYIFYNSVVAIALAIILAVLAFKADDPIRDGWEWTTILMVALSLLPALVTFGVLWYEADKRVKPMKEKADDLEKRAEAESR
jgi:hypothetical protein